MNPIKNNGKYFIKDAEISDSQNDKFKHLDIAKNIINIIENNPAPFNIAIVGKWGLGKSSLINIVKQHLSAKKDDYIIEDINAWKYEKEALKRVLLRRTLSSLDYTDKSVLAEFLDGLTSHKGNVQEVEKTFIEHFKSEWRPLIGNAFIIYVIGVIISIIGQCIISKVNVSAFDFENWMSFVVSGFASNFYIPLLVVLFEKFIGISSGKYNFKITPPMTSVDEYERELENRLSKEKYKNKKFIVIIDDLDRLTPNKIVEALDAIKAFVGYPNFIFIVPFDDTILKDAIKREKTNFVHNEHLTIESDLFLDKLFQYRISLPNVIQSDIPQYVIEAAQKDAGDLVQLCGEKDFKLICKEILIHKKVTTPRQAKKIVNTFANNLLLGYRREYNGVAGDVFTSINGKRFLAKISVLQADFPAFYSNVFIDNNIIDDFLTLTDSEEIDEVSNELLVPYFTKNESEKGMIYTLNKTGESLSMFLHRTAAVTTNNIARFLYLNDDKLSELFGNEFSLTVRDGLSSGEYKLVREKIEDNLDKDISNLLYEVLSNSDPIEFEFCCIGIINVSDIKDIKNDIRLMSLLNDRLESIFISNDVILAKGLNLLNTIDIFKLYNEFGGFDKLILNQFKNESNNIVENLTVFFEKEEDLSRNVKVYVKELISEKCSTTETKLTFDSLFEIDSLDIDSSFEKYFSDLYLFERIYNELVSAENYDEEDTTVLAFVKLFEKYIQNNNADEVLSIVEPNLESSEFTKLVIHNLVRYAERFKEISIISKVSNKLIETSNDNTKDDINLWLCSVKWEILSGQDKQVDKYIKENLQSKYIDDILLNVVNNNQVDLIPKTIDSVHDAIFDENIKISTLYELQKQYNATQMTDLIEKLKPAFAHSNSDDVVLNYAIEILKLISKDADNGKYIILIADYIYSQNSSYPAMMIDKLRKMSEFKQGISDVAAKKFVNWSNSNINSYFMSGIIILDVFKEYIAKTEYIAFSDKIMKSATEDTLELSLILLRNFRSEFKEETEQIKTYKNFLVSHLKNNYCRKSIIRDILDYYSGIGEVDEFICEIIKYDDIIDESIEAIIKFTEGYTEDQIEEAVQNVIETSSIENVDNVISILSGWLKARYSLIISQLLENVDSSISVTYGMNLVKLSTPMAEINLTLKINLFSILLDICDDGMMSEVLTECKKIGRLTKNVDKRKLGESFYKAFRNTAKEALKTQILSLMKLTATKSAFETDEERKKREFSDEERKLLKHSK